MFQLELAEVEGFEFEKLKEFHHGSRVTCFSWSPETSLILVPKVVKYETNYIHMSMFFLLSILINMKII